ncbi:hypothetical protein [Pseudarthrobacter sp. B4EP4b]|uniref:hypothetical protein n=1 Tax=Pseudarthrobacter sp. B4EP4b TaxID=2590664 RepID=UPI00114D8625|nr:hypothetical protein [Pseudarthrobacter sp. B4EP4b]
MPTVSNVRAEPRYWPAVAERLWDSLREEFTLPTAAEMEAHFRSLGEPEGMGRAVRVFIGEETFCPGFQLKDGVLHEPVLRLLDHAMALKVPHNVFAAWMVSPLSAGACSRPVDMLDSMTLLQSSLAAFVDRHRPVAKRR